MSLDCFKCSLVSSSIRDSGRSKLECKGAQVVGCVRQMGGDGQKQGCFTTVASPPATPSYDSYLWVNRLTDGATGGSGSGRTSILVLSITSLPLIYGTHYQCLVSARCHQVPFILSSTAHVFVLLINQLAARFTSSWHRKRHRVEKRLRRLPDNNYSNIGIYIVHKST